MKVYFGNELKEELFRDSSKITKNIKDLFDGKPAGNVREDRPFDERWEKERNALKSLNNKIANLALRTLGLIKPSK